MNSKSLGWSTLGTLLMTCLLLTEHFIVRVPDSIAIIVVVLTIICLVKSILVKNEGKK